MAENADLPDDFEHGLADEIERLLHRGKPLDQLGRPQQLTREQLEHLIHPVAEAFIQRYDDAGTRLDHGLSAEIKQFLHCLSQVVAGRLMTLAEIAALAKEVYAALAYSAIAGWLAHQAHAANRLRLPGPEPDEPVEPM